MTKIIVLQGSPHRDGNTVALTQAFLKGVKRGRRVQIDIVDAYGVKAAPILQEAYDGRTAPRKDAADAVVELVLAADAIVLATPVYYWGISAQLKLLWERLHAADARLLRGKQLAIVATGGGESKADSGADLIETQFRNAARYLKMKFKGLCFASSDPEPVAKNKKVLAAAERAGKRVG